METQSPLLPKVDHKHIGIQALRVLEANNISEPVVDVGAIAKQVGYEIVEKVMPPQFSDVAGFHDQDTKKIYLNKNDPPARKLFTVAHELGHIFLEHPNYSVLYRLPKKDTKYSLEESQANSFAAQLLMPDFMVRKYLQKYSLSRSDYETMADIFGVPLSAMRHTLDYLKV
ncbi:ImmA/IrrE family metallo-endopeptidase [Candidatus Kaiserbacteria bacterium]|nr:ImmA/IrrE family metallo-endopeptidase [Candidatus Kaiserbacteria bacterium]